MRAKKISPHVVERGSQRPVLVDAVAIKMAAALHSAYQRVAGAKGHDVDPRRFGELPVPNQELLTEVCRNLLESREWEQAEVDRASVLAGRILHTFKSQGSGYRVLNRAKKARQSIIATCKQLDELIRFHAREMGIDVAEDTDV